MPKQERGVIPRIVNKARSYAEADDWDVMQHIRMTPDERRRVAKELKRRFYGDDCPDVRDAIRK